MKNKFLFALMLPFLCLSSCSSSSPLAQIFIYDSTDPFIKSMRENLEADLTNFIAYQEYFAERKQTNQIADLGTALEDSRTKVILMNMVDRLSSSSVIEKAEQKKIPVVFFNREPLASDLSGDAWSQENCYYVGSDPTVEGDLQADIADDFFGGSSAFASSVYDKNKDGKVQVALLKGEQGHQDTEQRSQHCISKLRDLGYDVDLIDTAYCNWERAVASETMRTFSLANIELLFSNNDEMALGAIDYLLNPGKWATNSASVSSSSSSSSSSDGKKSFAERYFPIIGVDDTTAGQAALDKGYMTGTVLNDAKSQSSVIVEIVKHIISGSALPSANEDMSVSGNSFHVKGRKVEKTAQ